MPTLPCFSVAMRTAVLTVAFTLVALGNDAGAQRTTGFSPNESARQRAAEAAAIAVPDPAIARMHSEALSVRPHMAGTEGQALTRDYVIEQMRAMGLRTS